MHYLLVICQVCWLILVCDVGSGSKNGGFHEGVLASLDSIYLVDLSFKANIYQC